MAECKVVSDEEMRDHMREAHMPEHLIQEFFKLAGEKEMQRQSVQGSLDRKVSGGGSDVNSRNA